MARYKIEFCENNFGYGTEEVIERIENELDNAKTEVHSCIGFCDDCAASPFALIDGQIIQADTPDDLFEEIKAYIE